MSKVVEMQTVVSVKNDCLGQTLRDTHLCNLR